MLEVAPEIRNLTPYIPGKPIEETQREYGLKKVIKLASNENALGPSPKVLAAIKKRFAKIHFYPDGSTFELKKTYAQSYGIDSNQILFGNGSDELMNLLIQVYCRPGDRIVASQYGFVAYKIGAQAHCVGTDEVPMRSNFEYDIEALINFIKTQWTKRHKLIFLANPNNPTGSYIRVSEAQRLIQSIKGRQDLILVIDEAYLEFARAKDYARFVDFLPDTPNLILLRTFSKAFGLAGLRLGVMMADPSIVDVINRVRLPFNINSLAQTAGVAALQDKNHLRKSQKLAWEGLDYFYKALSQMQIKFWPSQGNFLLVDLATDSTQVYVEMLKRGIIVRPLKPYGLNSHLRISVGLMAENRLAIKALGQVLGKI